MILMRRLQISIDEELDYILASEAIKRHISRAAIIRELVRNAFGNAEHRDPILPLIGDIDEDAGNIDDVVYG